MARVRHADRDACDGEDRVIIRARDDDRHGFGGHATVPIIHPNIVGEYKVLTSSKEVEQLVIRGEGPVYLACGAARAVRPGESDYGAVVGRILPGSKRGKCRGRECGPGSGAVRLGP